MRNKILSVFMVLVMSLACASWGTGCDAGKNADSGSQQTVQTDGGEEANSSDTQKLQILKSDMPISEEAQLSRIKAEYLKQNNGYSDDDSVVAILSLEGSSLIDYYAAADTVADGVSGYAKTADGVREAAHIASVQQSLINKLSREGLIDGVEYTYSTVANAVAVSTTYGNFKKIENLTGTRISRVSLSDTFNLPQDTDVEDASAIVNAVDVYETGIYNPGAVEYTGKKTSVAILDSGFELSHSVFNVELQEDELALSRQYIEGKLNSTQDIMQAKATTPGLVLSDVYYSNKIPFTYDYADKDNDVFPHNSEHGTHVAGIIGGWDEANGHKGVAPDTQLVLMKVFPDVGDGATTEDLLAALEDAVLLGVDAINMSLGTSCGFAREPDGDVINDVYDSIEEAGISLLTAASNSYSSAYGGAQGNTNLVTNPDSGTVGSPSTYSGALSVASISGTKSKYLVANGKDVIFFDESNSLDGKPNNFFDELYEDLEKTKADKITLDYVVVPGVGRSADFAALPKDALKGKIAVIKRGDTTFEEKAQRAQTAGAAACIIYNNIDGDILMSMGKADHIPTISISKDDGTLLVENNGGKGGTITFDYAHEAGPFMSDFSSWGPLPDLQLKPEITAHGGNIRSSVPGNTFDELSGTSMATPNLCGLVVLIRDYVNEKFSGKADKELSQITNQLMMSTAGIVLNEEGVPYSPRKQGAGLASIGSVVNTRAYLTVDGKDKPKLELLDDPKKNGVYTMEFNVVNFSADELKYDLSLVGMTESVSTSDPTHVSETGHLLDGTFAATATGDGSISGNTVTVPANGTLKLSVKYTLTQGDKDYIERLFPNGMYVEGFVKLTALDDKNGNDKDDVNLNIPFLAFYGDWTKAPLFDKTYYEVEAEAHDMSLDPEDRLQADYYATTPYGIYFTNYIIPLGTYLYTIDESAYDPIPATEEHIAISNFRGAVEGIYAVYAGLLRNAKTVTYTITDKVTGEVKYTYVNQNAHKAFSQGSSPIPNYEELRMSTLAQGLMNNRQYEFKMAALLDYGDGGVNTNIRNTFTFDFYVDNESPVLRDAVFEKEYDRSRKEDRYYITLTIYDNHYVQSVQPVRFITTDDPSDWYTPLTPTAIPVYGDRNSDNVIRFEITDYLKDLPYDELVNSGLGFIIDDYALNSEMFYVMVPGTDLGTSSSRLVFTPDGKIGSGNFSDYPSVEVGHTIDLTQYLATTDLPADGSRDYLKYLVWTSSNTNKAKVWGGEVYGLEAGVVNITVSHQLYSNVRASIPVVIKAAEQAGGESGSLELKEVRFTYFDTLFAHPRGSGVSQIGETGEKKFITSLSGTLQMYPGEKIQLHHEISPWYEADKCVITYETTNGAKVSVTDDGIVTALDEGSSVVRMRIAGSSLYASLRIQVLSPFVISDARVLEEYKGVSDTVVIPDDEGILYIGPYAFSLYDVDNDIEVTDEDFYANRTAIGNPYIKKVIIPEGVQEIQRHAFYGCTALEEVVLPSTIKFIAQDAFYNNVNLKTINLNGVNEAGNTVWVQAIGDRAFYGCTRLTGINLSKTYAIGASAFEGCRALISVDITGLRNAGVRAFAGCSNLASVTMDPDGHTKLSTDMFRGAGLTSLTLYEKINIPAYAFAENASLGSVTFANAPQYISDNAFVACDGLQELTLPNGKVSLGSGAFSLCGNLGKLIFQQNTVISADDLQLGASAFAGTKIASFEVNGNNLYKTSEDGKLLLNAAGDTVILAATGGNLGAYTLPQGIKKIEKSAFAGSDLTSLTINDKDIKIGDYAFADCPNLESVTFPAEAGSAVIGDYAFSSTVRLTNSFAYPSKLTSVTNLDKIKTVGKYAFAFSALTNVTLAEGGSYGEGAFFNSSLTNVTIGANSSFAFGAFQRCSALTTVTMPQTDVKFGLGCFSNDARLRTIDLSHVTEIADEMFFGCTSLTAARLNAATAIGNYAFSGCASLTTVEIPVAQTIGEGAFAGDFQRILVNGSTGQNSGGLPLVSITLPSTLKSMGAGVFLGAYNLGSIRIPDGITAIPDFAFMACTSLATVTLPESVKSLGAYAFAVNSSLTLINLGSVETIGNYAFLSDQILPSINLGSAQTIGFGAFADCLSLGGTITANSLVSIDDYAFQATAITGFTAPALESIGIAAFQGSGLTEFVFGDKINYVGFAAFDSCMSLTSYYYGPSRSTSGVINDYALLENGALYNYTQNGALQLNSYPAGNRSASFTVKEGTSRIEQYAGSGNRNLTTLILPDSLKVIANYAFWYCDGLQTVQFNSITAPVLENDYNGDLSLPETAPGYDLLYGILQGVPANGEIIRIPLCYCNFIGLVGSFTPIKMILPANEKISGYDSLIYEAIFGKVSDAARSDYVAMESALRNFIDYANVIKDIEQVNSSHEQIISEALNYLNAITQDPTAYGYTKDGWDSLVAAVNQKNAEMKAFKLANASRTALEIQNRIDALPDSYDGSEELKNTFDQLRRDINMLTRRDRESLDLTRYNAFRASYEGYSPDDPANPQDPENPGTETPVPEPAGGCGGCGSTTIGGGFTMGGMAMLAVAALLAAYHVIRKKKNI